MSACMDACTLMPWEMRRVCGRRWAPRVGLGNGCAFKATHVVRVLAKQPRVQPRGLVGVSDGEEALFARAAARHGLISIDVTELSGPMVPASWKAVVSQLAPAASMAAKVCGKVI